MKIRENPIIYLAGKMWKYSEGTRKNVVLFFVLFTIANSIELLEPLLVAKILNTIQAEGVNEGNILRLFLYLAGFLGITLSFWSFHGPARVIENTNAFRTYVNYRRYLITGVMALPLEWHTDHHSGDTIDKIERGSGGLEGFSEGTFEVISLLVKLIGSYIILVYFNIHSAYIVLFMVVLAFGIIVKFDYILTGQYKELNKVGNKISEKIYDAISNITTIIILRVEKIVAKSIFEKMMSPLNLLKKNYKINEWKWFLVSVCTSLTTILVLGSYLFSHYWSGEIILIGSLYALYGYVANINNLFFNFADFYGRKVRQRASVANSEELAKDFKDKDKISTQMPANWKEMKIDSLTFSYHSEKEPDVHLDDVSLTIRYGERAALIGESGSGKTTFLKVVRDLYHPRSLNLYLDSRRIPEGFSGISSSIALIPQDPEIFATTILENITIGVDHDIDFVRKFTDMARFTDVVERLPKKFDSSIVEKGVNLSGGEKQRLALARGLMACEDKSIVLLDEPTSSIDSANELAIYHNIFDAFKDKAIISSIHRLHLLPLFDTIYFFRDGRIVASGTLAELLEKSEEFRTLWQKYHETANT
ncbi:MAG TPA: ABC transporter ATP-binding protein [Candidatus Paceibacterota bacterium]|nr:ABC transporter ATP-binding protein [Candidatus Paceibacterota bacterium]